MTPPEGRLRIVHVDTRRELRGGQRQLLMLAHGLVARGHTQLIVTPEDSGLESQARTDGLAVFPLPDHDPFHAHGILQLRLRLEVERADILHAHDGRGQTIAWLASLGKPVRRVASRRVLYQPRGLLLHRLKYTHTCDGVVAVSEFIRGLLVRSGVPKEHVEVIPDGVEIPSAAPDGAARAEARAQWGLTESDFVIGQVGAFTREKGQDITLAAVAEAACDLPDSRLVLVGSGPERHSEAVERAVHQLGARVRMIDYVENLPEWMAALNVLVMPSRSEGLGSSALVAMAQGIPVIAARVGGLPEIVENGRTGWLIPPESPQALAQALRDAAQNSAKREAFGQQARERARQFSSDIMAERTEAFYFRLLAR